MSRDIFFEVTYRSANKTGTTDVWVKRYQGSYFLNKNTQLIPGRFDKENNFIRHKYTKEELWVRNELITRLNQGILESE
jgi:hypothetical protein